MRARQRLRCGRYIARVHTSHVAGRAARRGVHQSETPSTARAFITALPPLLRPAACAAQCVPSLTPSAPSAPCALTPVPKSCYMHVLFSLPPSPRRNKLERVQHCGISPYLCMSINRGVKRHWI